MTHFLHKLARFAKAEIPIISACTLSAVGLGTIYGEYRNTVIIRERVDSIVTYLRTGIDPHIVAKPLYTNIFLTKEGNQKRAVDKFDKEVRKHGDSPGSWIKNRGDDGELIWTSSDPNLRQRDGSPGSIIMEFGKDDV